MSSETDTQVLVLTAEIVASYLGNNAHAQGSDIPNLIRSIRAALIESDGSSDPATEAAFPRASPRVIANSIKPDALISFIDGKPYKVLKRHLGAHGMDMAGYRERYGLPADYPSVAPSYSAVRSALMAKRFGPGAPGRATFIDSGVTQTPASSGTARVGRSRKSTVAE